MRDVVSETNKSRERVHQYLRQVPPRHAGAQHVKDCIHDLAVVNPRTLSALRQQRFE
jgi:hypothetical protein